MEQRFTIKARPKGTEFWTILEKGLTAEQAADRCAEEMRDDARWDEEWEYEITTEK